MSLLVLALPLADFSLLTHRVHVNIFSGFIIYSHDE